MTWKRTYESGAFNRIPYADKQRGKKNEAFAVVYEKKKKNEG